MYPSLHVQVKEHSVLVQVADEWQSWVLVVYSSISVNIFLKIIHFWVVQMFHWSLWINFNWVTGRLKRGVAIWQRSTHGGLSTECLKDYFNFTFLISILPITFAWSIHLIVGINCTANSLQSNETFIFTPRFYCRIDHLRKYQLFSSLSTRTICLLLMYHSLTRANYQTHYKLSVHR